MNVLVVIAHPVKSSFNHSLLKAVANGLNDAGHEARIADLVAEGFQPVMTEEDFGQFDNMPPPADVRAQQERIEWSDAIIFIFPIWWWSLPGILKGWIDRVMTYGWAWVDPADPDSGHLRHRKILVLATAGASAEAFAKRGYDVSLHTQLNIGTWDYCGFKDVTTRIFHDLHDETPQSLRNEYLEAAYEMGRNF